MPPRHPAHVAWTLRPHAPRAARTGLTVALALFLAVFERSRHPMLVVDGVGTVHEANDAVAELVGLARRTLVGRDRRDVVEPPAAHDQVGEQLDALGNGRDWAGTYAVGLDRSTVVDVSAQHRLVEDRHLVLFARSGGEERPAVAPRTRPDDHPRGPTLHLTVREREIVTLLAAGATSPQLAAALHLSEHTVRTHVRNAMARTGTQTRAHLAVTAWRAGLVGLAGADEAGDGQT